MTMVTYSYTGPVDYHAYNYGNYSGNAADLNHYLASGRGPYAQYQPVSILNYSLNSSLANIEIFLNPNGAGTPGGPYYGPNTLSAFLMLLESNCARPDHARRQGQRHLSEYLSARYARREPPTPL